MLFIIIFYTPEFNMKTHHLSQFCHNLISEVSDITGDAMFDGWIDKWTFIGFQI